MKLSVSADEGQLSPIIGNISSVLFARKQYFQAFCYINLCLSLNNGFDREKISKYEERREKCLKKCSELQQHSKSKDKIDKIEIVWDSRVGRFGVAKHNIDVGDVVLRDNPTVVSVR